VRKRKRCKKGKKKDLGGLNIEGGGRGKEAKWMLLRAKVRGRSVGRERDKQRGKTRGLNR
jgi:hypothetical protein